MKIGWRLIFAVTIAGLLLAVTDVPSDAARRAARGSSYDGTWSPYTHNVETVALFVLHYESSAAASILGTEAIKPTVLLERAAQST